VIGAAAAPKTGPLARERVAAELRALLAGPPPALALVGATGTGKSQLVAEIARPGLAVLSVDSMAVYREMDIGTATPKATERAGLPYYLIDVADPAEEYSIARYQDDACVALREVRAAGARPLLVGGTGLYLAALVDGLCLPGRYPEIAAELEAEVDSGRPVAELHRRLATLDPLAARRIEPDNRRRIVRALEVTLGSGRCFSSFGPGIGAYPPTPVRIVRLARPHEELDGRLEARLEAQLEAGWLAEAEALARRPGGLSRSARQALGYRELFEFLAGRASWEETRTTILRRTRALARRQEAWFRRDPRSEVVSAAGAAAILAAWAASEGRASRERGCVRSAATPTGPDDTKGRWCNRTADDGGSAGGESGQGLSGDGQASRPYSAGGATPSRSARISERTPPGEAGPRAERLDGHRTDGHRTDGHRTDGHGENSFAPGCGAREDES